MNHLLVTWMKVKNPTVLCALSANEQLYGMTVANRNKKKKNK